MSTAYESILNLHGSNSTYIINDNNRLIILKMLVKAYCSLYIINTETKQIIKTKKPIKLDLPINQFFFDHTDNPQLYYKTVNVTPDYIIFLTHDDDIVTYKINYCDENIIQLNKHHTFSLGQHIDMHTSIQCKIIDNFVYVFVNSQFHKINLLLGTINIYNIPLINNNTDLFRDRIVFIDEDCIIYIQKPADGYGIGHNFLDYKLLLINIVTGECYDNCQLYKYVDLKQANDEQYTTGDMLNYIYSNNYIYYILPTSKYTYEIYRLHIKKTADTRYKIVNVPEKLGKRYNIIMDNLDVQLVQYNKNVLYFYDKESGSNFNIYSMNMNVEPTNQTIQCILSAIEFNIAMDFDNVTKEISNHTVTIYDDSGPTQTGRRICLGGISLDTNIVYVRENNVIKFYDTKLTHKTVDITACSELTNKLNMSLPIELIEDIAIISNHPFHDIDFKSPKDDFVSITDKIFVYKIDDDCKIKKPSKKILNTLDFLKPGTPCNKITREDIDNYISGYITDTPNYDPK